MSLRPEVVAVTSLVVVEGNKAFREMLPKPTELRKAQGDAVLTAEIRSGELLASAVVLLGAGAVTALTGEEAPLVLGIITCVVLIGIYEYTLRQPGLPSTPATEAVAGA